MMEQAYLQTPTIKDSIEIKQEKTAKNVKGMLSVFSASE